jgi:two-component system, OmpR family, sensor kinase
VNGRSPIFRLVVLYCLLLLLLGAAFAIFTIRSFEHFTNETIYRDVRARSSEIWHTAQGALDDRKRLDQLLELRFAPEAQDRFIRISEGGQVLYQSSIPDGAHIPALSVPIAESESPAEQDRLGSLLLNTQTYSSAGGRLVRIDSGQSIRFSLAIEHSLLQSLIFGLPVLLILAAIGGYVLMRQSLRPIESMIDAAEAITFNNPGTRLPLAQTGDRLETLGLALNRMLDRLDGAYQFANRFSVDAAHELRTPLAIVRGELESISREEMSGELRAAHENMLEEVKRLGEMVDNLGMLSQMDSVWGKNAHEQVDLYDLTRETVDQMRLLAEEKQIAIAPIAGSATTVAGDRNRLKQVIVNLLDNAIKYTAPGGRIGVEVKPDGSHASLSISDTGIGISPEDQAKIFDRFYRVSTDRGETGSGLGLSIVKSICSAHGGNISVESRPEHGSIFCVELPLGTSAPQPDAT